MDEVDDFCHFVTKTAKLIHAAKCKDKQNRPTARCGRAVTSIGALITAAEISS
jgi:hypothetical protein